MADRPKDSPLALSVDERTREANARRLKRAMRAERAYLDRLQRFGTKPKERVAAGPAKPSIEDRISRSGRAASQPRA